MSASNPRERREKSGHGRRRRGRKQPPAARLRPLGTHLTMADAIRSVAARAAGTFTAYIGSSPFAPWSPLAPRCDTQKIQEDIRRLIRTLAWVRATLDDAENMEITEDSVRHLLRELQLVADAVEDVLDEFPYEAMRLGIMEDGGLTPGRHWKDALDVMVRRMVHRQGSDRRAGVQMRRPTSSTTNEISVFLYDVAQRVARINSRFNEIKEHKLGLSMFEESQGQRRVESPARQPTCSLMHESEIFGRKEDLEVVKQFLLSSDGESRGSDMDAPPVMAIVGMGGLGKTTLAQLAYNDDEVDGHFQLKSWVSVSENFDLVRLTRAMMESFSQEACQISELDPLQRKLEARLDGQSFLLVLDDVWEVDNLTSIWDQLRAPLRRGSAGSKIIVTTRSEKVSKMTMASLAHPLPCLQDEDCFKLLRQRAFQDRDPSSCQSLLPIGEKIAKKCGGLPLVAKTLGGLLRSVDDEGTWNNILESDILNIDGGNVAMAVLRLSYRHLPPHLKRCFRYCSVFPKGHPFDRDNLVRMWMAHGYIKANERKLMEDTGKEYFDDLLSRSFFQYSQKSEMFLMHDLIHDLARLVSDGECCSMEGDQRCCIQESVRHFAIVDTHNPIWRVESPKYRCEWEGLRSFLIINSFFFLFARMKVPNNLSTMMKQLRALDLSNTGLEELPDSIGCFTHLRYLGLRRNPIKQLPESVGSLCHLQTLDLEFSSIRCLPDSISNLLNLRHLIYRGHATSFKYPVGIGRLTSLQTMPGFHAGSEDGRAKLGELRDMNNIRSLVIDQINSSTDQLDEAKKACLEKKERLSALDLVWSKRSTPLPLDDGMLETLKPCPKLHRLYMSSFSGLCCPTWLGDHSFCKLATVRLDGCRNWTFLPPLGQLPSLKWLFISAAIEVKYIGREFFSGGFPKLEGLILEDMNSWKSWCGAQEGECPQLQRLHIERCERLESLSVLNLDGLQDLHIERCPQLQFSSDSLQLQQLPSLQNICIRGIHGGGHIDGDFSDSQSDIPQLEAHLLELKSVGQLETLYMLGEGSRIRRLTVTGCSNLTSLPLGNMDALKYVEISQCHQLRFSSGSLQLWRLPSLREFHVRSIHGAEYVHGFFSRMDTLQVLETASVQLRNVDHLEASSILDECPRIHRLTAIRCAKLTSLPLGNLDTLEYLKIMKCPQSQFLNVEHLPSTLRVLCIDRCLPAAKRWGELHQHQRLSHLLQSRNEGGKMRGKDNLCLVLRNVLNAGEAADFVFWELIGVRVLWLIWDCCTAIRSNANAATEVVLEQLRPNSSCEVRSLSELVIRGYMGLRFASWIGDPSYNELSSVTLLQCSQLAILPPLGQLPSLIDLYIEGAGRLERVGREFHGAGNDNSCAQTCSFPCLQMLEFDNMPIWEEWQGPGEGGFPSLCKLILKHCPKLRALPHLPPTLQELELEACDQLTSITPTDSYTQYLQSLESLRCLSLRDCPKLDFSTSDRPPSTLQYMALTHCPLPRTWCDGLLSMSGDILEIWVDGIRVCVRDGERIRSQVEESGMDGRISDAAENILSEH